MDNSLEMLLPIAGFVGGIFLWSRVAHMAIALSGLTPNPAKPRDDIEVLVTEYRRLVLRIAAAWIILVGAVLAYMVYRQNLGFAMLFAGIEAVPLLTVPNFLIKVRLHRRRGRPPESKTAD